MLRVILWLHASSRLLSAFTLSFVYSAYQVFFYNHNFFGYSCSNAYEAKDRFSWIIIIMKQEIKLIFFYLYFACFYAWLRSFNITDTFTYRNFLQWLVEVSVISLILIFNVFNHYIKLEFSFFDIYEGLYIMIFIVKVPLFIVICYAECHPVFFLNYVRLCLLYASCKLS